MTDAEGSGDHAAHDSASGHHDDDPDDDGDDRRWTLVRWGAGVLVLVGLIAFITLGASRPADPHLLPRPMRPQVEGFSEIAYRIDKASSNERCALLADTDAQQQKGLMNRTDLAGHDGMLFRFRGDTRVGFYMKDTLIPLSIAWFDSKGNFVSATDMEPCLDKVDCPNHYAARPYRYALEVVKGGLGDLGIGPGSHLSVGGTCA